MTDRRPSICEKRGCYIQPKSLFPEWDKLNERCKLCPYPVDHDEGWKEAVIAWEVCASLHREYAKGKDPFFETRQADFVRHAENARSRLKHEGMEVIICHDNNFDGWFWCLKNENQAHGPFDSPDEAKLDAQQHYTGAVLKFTEEIPLWLQGITHERST